MKTRLTDPDFDVDTFRDDRNVTPTVQIPDRLSAAVFLWQRNATLDDPKNCIVHNGTRVHICDIHAVFIQWERETW